MILTLHAIFIGITATIFMDLVALGQLKVLGIPSLNYTLMGRWICYIPKGRWIHRPIGQSAPIPYEAVVGWSAHYLIGIIFSFSLLFVAGPKWSAQPDPMLPIAYGAVTVLAPFLVLQPGMGAGVAARKTPRPWIARFRSLAAHLSFGIGLWLGAWLWTKMGW